MTTKARDDSRARHPERLAAGRDDPAVRARRIQHLREHAVLFPDHRRSRHRVHADPRAGDGALRRRRRARRRADRARLGRRACGANGGQCRCRRARRSRLREAELRQSPLGAGRTGRLALPDAAGSRRRDHRHRAGPRDAGLLRAAAGQRQRRVLVGRDRGQAADAGRRDRRGDRDRIVAARQPPAHHRHRARVEHAADRQRAALADEWKRDQAREHRAAAARRRSKRRDGSASC